MALRRTIAFPFEGKVSAQPTDEVLFKSEKRVQTKVCTLFQRVKKVSDFFARFKNATFFVKLTLHEKSRYARQKA